MGKKDTDAGAHSRLPEGFAWRHAASLRAHVLSLLCPGLSAGNPIPRQVAVAIPISAGSTKGSEMICLVTSRKHDGRWVLPKGGVEKGESAREAAVREMWEEGELRERLFWPQGGRR